MAKYLYRVEFDEDAGTYTPPACLRVEIVSDTPARVRIKGRPYHGWSCRSDVHRGEIGRTSFYTEDEAWAAWDREGTEQLDRYQRYAQWYTKALGSPRTPSVEAD